jgi:hypothetical protein
VISEEIFSAIVRHGYVDESPYGRRVCVRVGERRRRGRVHVPDALCRDRPAPTLELTAAPRAIVPATGPPRQLMTGNLPLSARA